ncbi:MAG: GDP-mannose 4,6-dehydratase [Anaerolineales bacterium]|nr:GDP-mannose 4,6-dehydratase [Anaerolineales bacterium]
MKKTRILITGIAGFGGIHLASSLLGAGQEIFGIDMSHLRTPLEYHKDVTVSVGNICDKEFIKRVLSEFKPDVIYHLAGVLKSDQLKDFYDTHVWGTLVLLDTVKEAGLKPKILVVSSSAVYGEGYRKREITEKFKYRPQTPYAMSKVIQEMIAHYYYSVFNYPIFFARTFNLIGPGQPNNLACSGFAYQIAKAEKLQNNLIRVGNLLAFRDFVDVRDVVHAYRLIVNHGKPGEFYNVCSGKATSIEICLETLIKLSQMPIKVECDPEKEQKNDVSYQVGNPGKIIRHTGWKAELPIERSLMDLLNYWRQNISLT